MTIALDLPARSRLSRPGSSVAIAALLPVGAYLAAGAPALRDGEVWRCTVAMVIAVAAANAFNDYRDVITDRLGHPDRPVPSGRLAPAAALQQAVACAFAAVVIGAISPALLAVFAIIVTLGLCYSLGPKGIVLLGNLMVAVLAASPIAVGAIIVGRIDVVTWSATAIVATFTLLYEVMKDLRDAEADAAAGLRTIATVLPPCRVGMLLRLLTVPWFVVTVLPCWTLRPQAAYAWTAILLVAGPLIAAITMLPIGRTDNDLQFAIWLTRFVRVPGLLMLVLLR